MTALGSKDFIIQDTVSLVPISFLIRQTVCIIFFYRATQCRLTSHDAVETHINMLQIKRTGTGTTKYSSYHTGTSPVGQD